MESMKYRNLKTWSGCECRVIREHFQSGAAISAAVFHSRCLAILIKCYKPTRDHIEGDTPGKESSIRTITHVGKCADHSISSMLDLINLPLDLCVHCEHTEEINTKQQGVIHNCV